MTRRHRRGLAATAWFVLVIGACGDDDEPGDTTTPAVANPASEYCIASGGTVDIVDEAAGQVGYCVLPDGSRVEEWEYFRSQTGSTLVP